MALTARACVFFCVADLASVKETLRKLACLQPETRFSLLQLFQEILPDQTLLSTLEEKLEKMCDESMDDSQVYFPDTPDELTDKFLYVLQSEMDDMDGLPTVTFRPVSSHNGGQSAPASWKAGKSSLADFSG